MTCQTPRSPGAKAFPAAPEPLFDLAQTVSAPQPAKQHREELLPAGHPAGVPLRIELVHLALEVRPRNTLENLTE